MPRLPPPPPTSCLGESKAALLFAGSFALDAGDGGVTAELPVHLRGALYRPRSLLKRKSFPSVPFVTSVHGAMPRRSSGVLPSRTQGNRPPPPPPPPPLSFPRDHISALPNDVITLIFSYLPFKDVVKTSALSRRWRYTWTTASPHLEFEFDGVRHRHPFVFQSHVDGVLSQFARPAVKKFHVFNFQYNMFTLPYLKLDGWLEFAEEHRVEDLRLRLIARTEGFKYEPPQLLYCLSRLVRLEVSACRFSLDGATRICWPRLKFLSMVSVELSDDILGRILRGSPVLESLELGRCPGMKNIVIDSTSVKDLVLVAGRFSDLEKIWAPDLLSLRVSGMWYPLWRREGISLDNTSSLVEAKLDFAIRTGGPCYKAMCCHFLKELLEKLREVPTITIGPVDDTTGDWCLQILSHLEMKGVPSPLSKCQNLILHAPVSQRYLPGIVYMLRSSQCLEKLVIHLPDLSRSKLKLDEESEERFYFDGQEFLCLQKGKFECLANHLKRVEIIGIGANSFRSKHLLTLIEFILGDALVLEKLVIKAKLPTPDVPLKLQKNVLSFRKASQNAKVIFV